MWLTNEDYFCFHTKLATMHQSKAGEKEADFCDNEIQGTRVCTCDTQTNKIPCVKKLKSMVAYPIY